MNHTFRKAASGGVMAVALITGTAQAQDLAALEARVSALEGEKVEAAAVEVTKDSPLKLDFYGYIKLDMVADNHYELGSATAPMAGVTADTPRDGGTGASVNESRIGVKGLLDSDIGPLKFNIEGDFNSNGGTTGGFRLRHAFVEAGPWLAGQTWSTWLIVEGAPVLLDNNQLAGGALNRVPQIRYTYRPNDQWRFAVALEEDYASGISSDMALSATLGYSGDRVKVGSGLIARQLETLEDDSVTGLGYSIGVDYDGWTGGKVQLQYLGGKGISTLINNALFTSINYVPAGRLAFDIDADGEAVKVNTFKAGITQKITDKSDITVAYGVQRYDEYAGMQDYFTREMNSSYLSYRYYPTKALMLAAEVGKVERVQFDGESFDNTRFQTVVKFTF